MEIVKKRQNNLCNLNKIVVKHIKLSKCTYLVRKQLKNLTINFKNECFIQNICMLKTYRHIV